MPSFRRVYNAMGSVRDIDCVAKRAAGSLHPPTDRVWFLGHHGLLPLLNTRRLWVPNRSLLALRSIALHHRRSLHLDIMFNFIRPVRAQRHQS